MHSNANNTEGPGLFDMVDNSTNDVRQRIDYLRSELARHNHNYYVLNAPEIGDREFDEMMAELSRLEKEHPEYDDPLSPTRRVGSDLTKGFEQAAHIYPMLSLANTYSIQEVDEYVRRCREGLMGEDITFVGEMKFDGTSISLIYEDGQLVRAVTRGDGEKGDVVTENVKTIRGEIVLPWKAFDRLNTEREYNEEPLFANPRNAAAGTLKTLNPAEVSRRGLDAYFYYLLGEDLPCQTHYDNMMEARKWGFKVSDVMTRLHSLEEVDEFISRWDVERKTLPVATDGLVFKIDSLRQQLNLGFTSKTPRWAIAYKFQAERALTPLKFVSFEVGRMGIITPVANLEPVLLSGTVVKRASLHNEDIIRQLDIHEHDTLYVEKGGEIIPKITGVDLSKRKEGEKPIEFVKFCPACGTPLVRVEGEAAWMCPDKYGCPPQITGRVEHFVGRRMMDIDGIGEEIAEVLFATGLVKDIADIYTLTREKLMGLDRFGEKSADRIMEGIRRSLDVPFERVIFALSIPYVGETVARRLARAVGSMERLMGMTEEELTAISDIGPRIARSIREYLDAPVNKDIIRRLTEAGVQMAVDEPEEGSRSDKLAGKTIVISGTFALHSRDQYKEMIERNGGKNSGSISKKTDYVLAGENMGPAKLEKASKLGIPIINEEEFLKMLE